VRKSVHVVRINADELDSLAPLSTLIRGLCDPSNQLNPDFLAAHQANPSGMWLMNDVQALLERISAKQPIIVAIDDVDRADDMSVHAVRLLIRAVDTSPIVWFLTGRGHSSPRLAELRSSLLSNAGLVVALAPLSEEETADLITAALGRRPPEELLERARGAAGNPFLLNELVQGYQEVQEEYSALPDASRLPERVREAARARLASLDPRATEVLDVAAVIGRAFSVDDLAGPTGQSLAQILSAVRRLQQLNVIVDSGDHFMFRHEILRESILADMPADVSRALHREVAALFLKRGRPPADLAKHLLAGVGPDDAAMAGPLMEASERLADSAPHEAQDLAARALDVTAWDHSRWLSLAPRAITVQIAVADLATASSLLDLAVDRGLDLDHEASARAQLCDALWRTGRTTEAVEMLAPVLGRADLSVASVLRLEVVLARTRVLAGAPAEAADLLARVVAQGRDLGERETVTYALTARSMALRFVGDIETSIVLAREAVSYLGGAPWAGVDPRIWLARALIAADRLSEAEDLCGRVMNGASGPTGSRDLPLVSATLARLLMAKGQVGDVLTEAKSGIAAMEADGSRELAAELFGCAAVAAWFVEGTPQATRLLEAATTFTATNAYGMNHLEMARVIVDGDEPEHTAVLVDPLVRQLEHSHGQLVFDPMHAPALVRRLLAAGMRSPAEVIVEAAERLAGQNQGVSSWIASAAHAVALTRADADGLIAAGATFTEGGRPLAAALAHADAANALSARRDPATREIRAQAVARLQAMGAHAAAERLMQGSPSGTSARRTRTVQQRPVTGWGALTPAELRVVDLAARGATNKEIAKELWLSPYTVDTHMRHSLAKLGLRSRVALARLAAQRQ
jgi:DNA-binding CsgD family transcriptional regulator